VSGEAAAKLLWDARRAADRIARITTGKSLKDYMADEVLRWAVERQFSVVGEVLAALRRLRTVRESAIPDLARVVAFRNTRRRKG
jgi:uncharacterized protein with HEPN domain